MKKLFIFFFFYASLIFSQIPTHAWSESISGSGNDAVTSSVNDANGNTYITGFFQGTADFDPGPGTFTLASAGLSDCYITKLDSSGNLVWVKQVGSSQNDIGSFVVVDASGNLYLTGYYSGIVDLDPTAGTFTVSSNGQNDVFLLKITTSGNFVFGKAFGGSAVDTGYGIEIDNNGNINVAGFFSTTVDFDPGPGTYTIVSAGGRDIFACKFDPSGNLIWARGTGGTQDDSGSWVDVDGGGNIYITGYFNGTTDFNPGAGTYTLTSTGGSDIFVLKLDQIGNFVWAKKIGSVNTDVGTSIAVNQSGDILFTGYFRGLADFDPGAGTYTLSTAGIEDVFICKFSSAGNFLWAKQWGSTGTDLANSLVLDNTNHIYLIGGFSNTVDFDPGVGTYTATSAGQADVFLMKLDSIGTFAWLKIIGGTANDYGKSLALRPNGDVVYCGSFQSTVDLNPDSGINNSIATQDDVFIIKLGVCYAPVPPVNITTPANQMICSGNTASLSFSGAGILNWYSSPTSSVVINSGPSYVTSVLSAGSYTYYVSATTCTSSPLSSVIVTVSACTGVNAQTLLFNSLNIFPNPNQGAFVIKYEFGREASVSIANELGQEVYVAILNSNTNCLNISTLTSGLYLIRFKTAEGVIIRKLVVD